MIQAPGTPLPFETAENFRELGGWPTMDGRHVKHGLFWRCGALCQIASPADRQRFENLGIKVICDLRSSQERAIEPDPEFEGIRYHRISAILNPDGTERNFDPNSFLKLDPAGLKALGEELGLIYARLPFNNEAYRAMFREIMDDQLPLLFHCSAGKDRTGVAAALILLALGASRETVMEDFLLTNTCRPQASRDYAQAYGHIVEENPQLKPMMEAMGGVRRENMEAVLAAIDAKYPVIEDYFAAEYGIGPQDLARLRDRCLE